MQKIWVTRQSSTKCVLDEATKSAMLHLLHILRGGGDRNSGRNKGFVMFSKPSDANSDELKETIQVSDFSMYIFRNDFHRLNQRNLHIVT
jgi:hypothetical protein